MSTYSRYRSFAPYVLRRWYWVLTLALTLVVWGGLALGLRPIPGPTPDRYDSYPYGFFTGMEDSALDLLFQMRNARHPELRTRGFDEPITIIEVDEASIKDSRVRLQNWPRSWYAGLVNRASAGDANMIGFDVYLSEAGGISEADKTRDQELITAIENAGNVVLVRKLGAGGSDAITPLPMFADVASSVGFADLPHDNDRLVRTSNPQHTVAGADGTVETLRSFASLIAQTYLGAELETSDGQHITLGPQSLTLRKDLAFQIDFRDRSPAFRRISAKDVLCEDFRRDSNPALDCDPRRQPADSLFKDRIVLIGATNNDAPDLFTTPFYSPFWAARLSDPALPTLPKLMPGIEVHANEIATMLWGADIVRLTYQQQVLFLLVPLTLVALAVFWLRALWGFLATIAVGLAVLWLSLWAFEGHQTILPLASSELGLLFILTPSGFLLRYAHERAVREEKEAERAAIMDIFSKCVSPEVADTLWQQRKDLSLGGERRTVTIIFTDIRGFTTLSESVSSEVVVAWLNDYFSRMHQIVSSYGGHINKFIGDGLMIVFGAPIARGDRLEARAATACGLEMLEEVERMNAEWQGTGRPHIAIGVGIHTGEATCGVVGAEGRLEYTIIGDTVNLSARLESTTKEKGVPILISGPTAALLGVDYETQPLGDVKVKGKTQSTVVFTVKKAERKQAESLVAVG